MTWFVESQATLRWSIGKLEQMPALNALCDPGAIMAVIPGLFESASRFLQSLKLRPINQIETVYDETYDNHCLVRAAIRQNTALPEGLNEHTLWFRHFALNWIVGYCGQAWDEVTPDA